MAVSEGCEGVADLIERHVPTLPILRRSLIINTYRSILTDVGVHL